MGNWRRQAWQFGWQQCIEVGDKTVSFGEFQREYQNRLNQFSQYVGRQLTAEQARQFGVAQITIQQLQTSLLEAERTSELKLGVDDNFVLKEIRTGPTFKNELGQFDRFRFQDILRRTGYSEGEYVEILRSELKRRQLTSSLALPENKAPTVLLDTLFAFAAEKRSANYVELLDTSITDSPTPTNVQLTEFILDNPAPFTAPEYRKAVYLSLTAKDFTDQVEVTDAALKEEYEGRLSEFNVPAKRSILQMIFENEEDANAAASKLSSGTDFAAVAKEALQLTQTDIDLGAVTKNDLLDELQGPVFEVPLNGTTVPVKTVLGWHLVKVAKIVDATQKALDEVKDLISNDIALRKASEIMFEKATALQDEFAGGATVKEAGESTGVAVLSTDWLNNFGNDSDNKAVADLPIAPEFLRELFSKTKEADIDLTESTSGTYFAVAVEEIKPSAVKDLAQVREIAATAWQADWRHQENKKIADELIEKLKGGAALASLASKSVSTVKTTQSLRRSGQNRELTADAAEKLFTLKDNEFAAFENVAKDGFILLSLNEVTAADATKEKEIVDRLKEQLSTSIQQDIMSQYLGYLEKEIGVSVKSDLIREYF
ncbi:MAG: peptidyl-prolyl cis-trans isomerase [Sneathiella sp.]|nr:peptidyl-prolyl cis-trans isomerase [Sneathiella sp.]